MKVTVPTTKEIDIKHIYIEAPVRYGDEDIPYDFPLRVGDMWRAKVEIDTGKIVGWPIGQTGDMHMKVTDSGTYTLLDDEGAVVAKREQEYVPDVIPGEYSDYIILGIDANGIITNWPKKPDLSDFFVKDDD